MSTQETAPHPFDPDRAERFVTKMLGVLNGGSLSLMSSIGHQTGLFDVLAGCPASTSEVIAAAAGLDERYVREWLGAMVTGGIVEYTPASRTYRLPPEHAACLTRASGPNNLAASAQYVALLADAEQKIVQRFRDGGGLDYSHYPRFHALMAEDSAAVLHASLLDRTLPRVAKVDGLLSEGADVLDVGCGRGIAIHLIAERFPESRCLGIDFSEEAIAWARAEAERRRLPNARFEACDAAALDRPRSYDFITAFDAIHDQAQPRRVLRRIREALRPEGTFLMVDIAASSHLERNLDHPLAPFLYTASTLHCTSVSLAYGGEGLGTCWGEELARELLAEAGFSRVEVTRIDEDPFNAYYVCRPGPR